MAATLKASRKGLQTVDAARRRKGWNATSTIWYDAAHTSLATLKRFRRGIPIDRDAFIGICQAVGVEEWEAIVDDTPREPEPKPSGKPEFSAYDDSWVGREQLVTQLGDTLRDSCRLLLILGLTGIGKTALAEKLATELEEWIGGDWKNKFRRANFDNEVKSADFASVATRWLEEWGEKLAPEDRKPERLLPRLIQRLQGDRALILIDSMERLLSETDDGGWGDFADEWWEKFFQNVLSAESFASRIIVTSQDFPVRLKNIASRYPNFWHREVLYGLNEDEQNALFEKTGFDVSEESSDRTLLMRLGKAYKGHPLVLRVTLGEIWESFEGNIPAYWDYIQSKIEEVERDLAEAEKGKTEGAEDEWELHKLTREVRDRVNKQRLEAVFDRLQTQVPDAYLLICASSVYRVPVQEEGWLMQLARFVKRRENQQCDEARQEAALEQVENRFLAEISFNHNHKRLLGQHNLVRSVALEHHKQLLNSLKQEVQ